MKSAIFTGFVSHQRSAERAHGFRYRMYMYLLDLSELDQAFQGIRSHSIERWNLVSYFRRDFLGDPGTPLIEAVRDRVEAQLGRRPLGAIQLMTQLRTFGYVFNPVSFFYCYSLSEELLCVLAQVRNTFGEKHLYVCPIEEKNLTPDHIKQEAEKRKADAPTQQPKSQ